MKQIAIILLLSVISLVSFSSCTQDDNNQAIENIMTRHSVRSFQDKEVEQEKVTTLLKAGMAAPTWRDLQPWHFVVVQGKDAIENYASGNPHHAAQIRATPLIIVLCGDTTRMQESEARDFWVEDCSASAENILLAAHALGLGAVWTSAYPEMRKVNGIRRNLRLPDNLVPFAVICIGYSAEEANVKDKWDENKITYWK